jgi:hypothetical protein
MEILVLWAARRGLGMILMTLFGNSIPCSTRDRRVHTQIGSMNIVEFSADLPKRLAVG